jgi:hypothetical protein
MLIKKLKNEREIYLKKKGNPKPYPDTSKPHNKLHQWSSSLMQLASEPECPHHHFFQ